MPLLKFVRVVIGRHVAPNLGPFSSKGFAFVSEVYPPHERFIVNEILCKFVFEKVSVII